MNFRLVWMGPEEDDPQAPTPAVSAAIFRKSKGSIFPYALRGSEMIRQQKLSNGPLKITPLTNFQGRIVRDIRIDDGTSEQRELGIEAVIEKTKTVFSIPASQFNRMNWVLEYLGPRAIVYPGQHQHARAAIQWLSGQIQAERIYTHLGWRKHDGSWLYFHSGGALGADGPNRGVRVQLPDALLDFRFTDCEDSAGAVRDSLAILGVAPDRISLPLLAAVYAAALGSAGFSLFFAGGSGVFKTALATLCQQHFGAALDASRLPASFASTANAIEALAFHAKNALLVVDDFAPSGTASDHALNGIAERLFRAAGNRQGRSRMVGGTPSVPQPPRGLILATGEDVPKGHSVRARLLILDVGPGEVDLDVLTRCQKTAREGRLAASLAAFIGWVARRYDALQLRRVERVERLQHAGLGRAIHARLPTAIAELQASFEIFLEFAC
jgi:hypothetical protein